MKSILIVNIILVITHSILSVQVQYSDETTKEVCIEEELDIRCRYNEVIAMTSALYGHLHQGRCIPRDFGHFGCKADVLPFLDKECSGKRSCVVSMMDTGLTKLKPLCALGLGIMLETNHICITGQPSTDFCRVIPVQQSDSYFLSLTAGKADCLIRNNQAFVSLAANEGQRIKLTITSFNNDYNISSLREKFAFEENGQITYVEFSTNGKSTPEAEYRSSMSRLTLILKDLDHNAIIGYQATGCLDMVTPPNTWTKKDNVTLTVGCYNSDQTWTLSCVGTKWIGAIGNCTARPVDVPKIIPNVMIEEVDHNDDDEVQPISYLSKELWIVIISVTTLFACGFVFLVGFICVKLAKRKYIGDKNYERCEMVPLDANLRPIRNGDVKDENIRAWQQTMTSQGNNRSLARNNNGQLIVMDQDLITINGI